jgi:hypothetical protein
MPIDTTKPFRRPADLVALVSAVLANEISTEGEWIEWKAQVRLDDGRWGGGIARHLLGFGNRDPEAAGRWAGGCAYFVAGLEPGNLVGVTPVDVAVLDVRVSKFIGEHGPQWSPHYVRVGELDTLVVIIEPPRPGDPIFTLQQNFEDPDRKAGYSAGEVFVRRRGRTEKAAPADISRLTARANSGNSLLGIGLECSTKGPVTPLDLSVSAVEAWLATEAVRLARPPARLGAATTPEVAAFLRAVGDVGRFGLGENRTALEYDREVQEFLRQARVAVASHATVAALRGQVGRVELDLVNATDENYTDVEVRLEAEGSVSAFFEAADVVDDYPAYPRPWGTPRPLLPDMTYLTPGSFLRDAAPPPGWVSNGGSFKASFRPEHLRPRDRVPLPPIYIIADSTLAGSSLAVRWRATATNASGVAEGQFSVDVSSSVVTPSILMSPEGDGGSRAPR